jgi:hypothetical protein
MRKKASQIMESWMIDTGGFRGKLGSLKKGCPSQVTLNHRVGGSSPSQPTELLNVMNFVLVKLIES